MRYVKPTYYSWLNRIIGTFSVSILALYAFALFTDREVLTVDLGLETTVVVITVLTFLFSVIGFYFLKKNHAREAALSSLALFSLVVVGVVHSTGGIASPFFAVWLTLILISGVFGPLVLSSAGLMTALYYVVTTVDQSFTYTDTLNLFASFVAVGLGYYIWRRFYLNKGGGKVHELSSQLSEEQLKSEMLIQSIGDGVLVIDNDGIIQLFNPAAVNMTGWNADEAVGLDHRSVMQLQDEGGAQIKKGDNPFDLSMIKKESVVRDDVVLQTKSGKKIDLSLIVSPLKSSNEVVTGAIGVFRDISKEKSAMKQRAEFISTASHEMRTPVAAIEGYLALALNPKVSTIDEKAKDFIMKAHESTQHLGKLFQDLLSAAKSEDGRLSNHPQVIELGDLLQKITDDARFTAEKKGLQLEYRVGDNQLGGEKVVQPLYYAHIDEERFREVVTNLMNNAIKFTEEGRVIVSITGTSDTVQISVRDTGVGIPPEDIPHLFQKFYRVDNSATRTIGGTGLGLFISRNIVEQLFQGRIWVESEVDQGSTFFIEMPRLSNDQAMQLKQQEESQINDISEEGSPMPVASPSGNTLE